MTPHTRTPACLDHVVDKVGDLREYELALVEPPRRAGAGTGTSQRLSLDLLERSERPQLLVIERGGEDDPDGAAVIIREETAAGLSGETAAEDTATGFATGPVATEVMPEEDSVEATPVIVPAPVLPLLDPAPGQATSAATADPEPIAARPAMEPAAPIHSEETFIVDRSGEYDLGELEAKHVGDYIAQAHDRVVQG